MNTTQLLNTFFTTSVCSNSDCAFPFAIDESTRCPLCDEPALLPAFINPSFLIDDLLKDTNIGSTPLTQNKSLIQWTGIKNLYIKEEYTNPSGSFKDRGSWTALQLLYRKLQKDFIIGTVSTGNMAISTAFMANLFGIDSFVVVSSKTSQKKIEAIEKAAGKKGTNIFIVEGEYAALHSQVYEAARILRSQNIPLYPQLTDDIFRIIGYASLFNEIIDQLQEQTKTVDILILPVASGALFRVAVWALESAYRAKKIKKIPRIVLVQEKGADPIIEAFQNGFPKVTPLTMTDDVIGSGIDVSFSRSGNPSLEILRNNYHICMNVTPQEIQEAYDQLHIDGFYPEEASAASVAAAKKLQISESFEDKNVVCVLTGGNIQKRSLGKSYSHTSEKIFCTQNELQTTIIKYFEKHVSQNMGACNYYC